ncbi:MAG: type III PLP-dependent enzyme [Candidatus ainarchaeum sp.]|nr:type III PLP-dependent enzyme [Candidatus ainarchaeum sp.]
MNNKPITEFMSLEEFEKIKKFTKGKETPFLVINIEKIEKNYEELVKNLPYAKIYYAVKANPHPEVIKLLDKKGSNFDIATIYELDQLLDAGISPDRISYGNTIKKEKDIAYAYSKGIRLFATDSKSDLQKLSKNAPGSKVFFRILCETSGSDWPLSRKFGAHQDLIYKLILECKNLNLEPYGLSFHVGSQQRDIGQWDNAISQCKYLFDAVKKEGIKLKMINLGGGLPSRYIHHTLDVELYANEITRYLKEDFEGNGNGFPEIIIEPGRSLVGDAGVIISEIIMISKKSHMNQYKWVYLDIGKFGGLIETIDESIKYPIFTEKEKPHEKTKEIILAGPTCDSMDTLYENYKYSLPEDIKEGERVYILSTGAYTQTYSSTYFNGIPPLKVYILE